MRPKIPRQVELVGGPRDGDVVPYSGYQYCEAVPVGRGYVSEDIPTCPEFRKRIYDLRWYWLGDTPMARYVLSSLVERT